MRNNRLVATVVALAATCLALAGCSSAPAPPPPAVPLAPFTSLTTPPTVPVPARTSDGPEVQAALSYLRSPERSDRYQRLGYKAGTLVARALQAGTFGPVKRYNESKEPLQRGQVGWGGITTLDNSVSAWVYWLEDGSIDYAKRVTDYALTNRNGDPAMQVLIFAPDANPSPEQPRAYWTVYVGAADDTVVSSEAGILSPSINNTQFGFHYPTTIGELRQLDDQAIAQMTANLRSRFGPAWNR